MQTKSDNYIRIFYTEKNSQEVFDSYSNDILDYYYKRITDQKSLMDELANKFFSRLLSE